MSSQCQPRSVLLVPNLGREINRAGAIRAAEVLIEAGVTVRTAGNFAAETIDQHPKLGAVQQVSPRDAAPEDVDLVLALGGDGTFLRAASAAHAADIPVLGINLGHVGFLAEREVESLDEALARVIAGGFRIEDRMTLDVTILDAQRNVLATSWALNELSVENLSRAGVLDAIVEVDLRPVNSFGCDGVLVSTPTGSTAYAFSAGGPVLWPELDAILVVPNNAHALFTKPLVISPRSTVAVESSPTGAEAAAVLDGFRTITMPPGARAEVVVGQRPVRWVRLDDVPFADRLVTKFHLPVQGWRGPWAENAPA